MAKYANSEYSLLLTLIVYLGSATAVADPLSNGDIPVDNCELAHVRGTCKPAPLSAEDNMQEKRITMGEIQFKRKLTLPEQELKYADGTCEAHFAISYFQAGEAIKVDTEVTNESCEASGGEYELRVRAVDGSGDSLTRSFSEVWSRTESEAVKLQSSYPMLDAERLVWVRVKSNAKTACQCI